MDRVAERIGRKTEEIPMLKIRRPMLSALVVLAACVFCWQVPQVPAASPQGGPFDREARDYTVYVDNRPAGQFQITIVTGADGRQTMSGHADVRVKHLFRSYSYSYRGSESWAGHRPVRVEAATNDDGKEANVSAVARQDGTYTITANGEQRNVPDFHWTTTYWRLPRANVLQEQMMILDVDSGRVWTGKLQAITPIVLNLSWRKINCTYYKLETEVPAELWFDQQGRLVRQITVEDNHRTELRLSGLRKLAGQ
jgi:hypothetical protein